LKGFGFKRTGGEGKGMGPAVRRRKMKEYQKERQKGRWYPSGKRWKSVEQMWIDYPRKGVSDIGEH